MTLFFPDTYHLPPCLPAEQDEMSDSLHVICTKSQGVNKTLVGAARTHDMSREVESQLRFWGPEKPGKQTTQR